MKHNQLLRQNMNKVHKVKKKAFIYLVFFHEETKKIRCGNKFLFRLHEVLTETHKVPKHIKASAPRSIISRIVK